MTTAILESLWRPLPKETLAGINQVRYVSRNQTNSGVGTSITVTLVGVVPVATVRVVLGISIRCTPGGGRLCLQQVVQHQINGSAGSLLFDVPDPNIAAGAAVARTFQDVGWLMMPGESVLFNGLFNAGATSNLVEGSFWGFDIPRGNLEF